MLTTSAKDLAAINDMIELKDLYLSADDVSQLDLTKCEKLESINIDTNSFDLKKVGNPQNLKKLILSLNGIKSISHLGKLQSLVYLDLYYTPLTVKHLNCLVSLKKLQTLRLPPGHEARYKLKMALPDCNIIESMRRRRRYSTSASISN